jgi:hypothetical protein
VRETFGAAVARFQAATARDADVRATLRGIADDEQRHCELSLRIHQWLEPMLSDADRARLERAARAAITELWRETRVEPAAVVRRLAGMPDRAQALALLDALGSELWDGRIAA